MEAKPCRKCGDTKPLTEFHRASGTRDGHRGECKQCFRLAAKARYPEVRDKSIERAKRWREQNLGRFQATQRVRRQRPENKAKEREAHLLRKYGITQAAYEALFAAQGGGCAICERPPLQGQPLHVDHDPESGAVRQLLCVCCNNGLRQFQEEPSLLMKAAGYLDRHSADPVVLAAVRARVAALPRWPRG